MSFFVGAFAVAGALAASVPVVIHLLNRRRQQTVAWAAMDFLRQALARQQRILQLRHLLLLALRTLCVLLFGLAMARPYFSASGEATSANQPVHCLVLIDHSLSMGMQHLGGTLLSDAKARARAIVRQLPPGSRVSVLPICQPPPRLDAYESLDDALDAIDAVGLVDRMANLDRVVELAKDAIALTPEPAAKRIVLISDQQAVNWPASAEDSLLAQLPELQIVPIRAEQLDNAWVAEVRLLSALTDTLAPTTILTTIRYQGQEPRRNVQVTMLVDALPVASQTVDLQPDQALDLEFVHQFETAADAGNFGLSVVEIRLSPDRLPEDDSRLLVAPVAAALPVVFVDEQGAEIDALKGLRGETYHWRQLLSPQQSDPTQRRRLVNAQHLRIEQLSREVLQDARLVILAGVADPAPAVELLRDYVEQGGQLVIAAGGEFDPAAWQAAAWREGQGILPLPLAEPSTPINPREPALLDPRSTAANCFHLEGFGDEALADLYRSQLFFSAVSLDEQWNPQTTSGASPASNMPAVEIVMPDDMPPLVDMPMSADIPMSAEIEMPDELTMPDAEPLATDPLTTGIATTDAWLRWAALLPAPQEPLSPDEFAEQRAPRTLARLSNGWPCLVERQVGRGRILFFASGVQPLSNTMSVSNAVLVFDRLFRELLLTTLPERNVGTVDRVLIPLGTLQRQWVYRLTRPDGFEELLAVEAIDANEYALALRNLTQRGLYRISASLPGTDEALSASEKVWEVPLAAAGPANESLLAPLGEAGFAERFGNRSVRWLGPDEPLSLPGAAVRGEGTWRLLMVLVLLLLVSELVLLAWPARRRTLGATP